MSKRLLTSTILTEIRKMLEVEILSQPATGTIELNRSGIVLAFAALADAIGDVEVLEESAGAADRLTRELAIAHAEIERLQLQLIARDLLDAGRCDRRPWDPTGKGRIERAHRRGTKVIDITEAMGRERREAGRPVGPDGGAA